MEQRKLGNSDLRVSIVGLGTNNFGRRLALSQSRAVIDRALELGVNLIDTADIYSRGGSEEILGQVLGERRKDVVLATKFGMLMDDAGELKGASSRYVTSAVEASLRRLKTDWIDLYQLHRPDPETPMEETLRALDDLVGQGKVRYIGCSNLPAWQVVEAQWLAKDLGLNAFVCCQDEYSLLVRDIDRDLAPMMQAYGLGLLPFFPLASGMLTGKYRRGQSMPEGARLTMAAQGPEGRIRSMLTSFLSDANYRIVEGLEGFCAERGRTLLELAFSWLAARTPVASVIAGATSADQIEQNVAAVGWSLTPEDLEEIDRLTTPEE